MNEQIKQLAIESKLIAPEYNGFDHTRLSISQQKFAELIVRECMRMCEVVEMSFVTHDCDVEASGAITVKQFIAEHFGVES